MSYPFTAIVIIFNPNSTGDSMSNAKKLQKALIRSLPKKVSITLIATERAAHAEEIALDVAIKNKRVLIVSSSGDGGYNEVLNGLLKANNPHAAAVVLPSGNANDHHEAISLRSLEDKIRHPRIEAIDAIKVAAMKDGKSFTRYAHSYVGVGLTAYIGKKLTEATLNPVNEKWLVLKYLLLFKGVTLKVEPDLRWHRYSSIVFGNISRMSKIIKLAPESHYDDGKIEVYELRTKSFIGTTLSLLFGSTFGLRPSAQLQRLSFRARRPVQVQFDGEVIQLDARDRITVSVDRSSFKTLL